MMKTSKVIMIRMAMMILKTMRRQDIVIQDLPALIGGGGAEAPAKKINIGFSVGRRWRIQGHVSGPRHSCVSSLSTAVGDRRV